LPQQGLAIDGMRIDKPYSRPSGSAAATRGLFLAPTGRAAVFAARRLGWCRGLASPPLAAHNADSARPPVPPAYFFVAFGIVEQVLKMEHRGASSKSTS